MPENRLPDPKTDTSWKAWLLETTTVTLPRWGLVCGAGVAVLLLLVALD